MIKIESIFALFMKKILVSIWMICYLALTIGVSVNFHYCMNKLDSTKLFASASKYCNKCGMHTDKSHGCCRDEVKVVKADDDQKLTALANMDLQAPEAVMVTPSEFLAASFWNASTKSDFHSTPPPLLAGQETYILNSVFRI